MDLFKAIEARHSYRGAFTDAPVSENDLIKIVDAGLRAPSGCNAQTTSFIIVTNKEIRSEIAKLLPNNNVITAPALIIAITEKITFDFGLDFEVEDYSACVENILLSATALGYASCWLDGQTRKGSVCGALEKLLNVPSGKHVRSILPLGIPAQSGEQAARKPFEERVGWLK